MSVVTNYRTLTPNEAYGEMLALIESTHWTKKELACPIYPANRTRVPDTRPAGERNPSGWRYIMVTDYSQDPIKHVYCLVGLLIKVIFNTVEGEESEEAHEYRENHPARRAPYEYSLAWRVPNAFELVEGLFNQLPEEAQSIPTSMRPPKRLDGRTSIDTMIQCLELWNDDPPTTKKMVENLIRRAYEATTVRP